ncbi:MAG: PadR family transcriptional regulator [Candidatus Latescibacterota bacterium]
MTLNEALILSYVKRGIGYGYNILSHVKESRSDEWVNFSRAGLYKTLDRLEKSGLLKKTFEQNGSWPLRKVYHITQAGEKALDEFLNKDFNFNFQTKYELDAYLVAAVAGSPDAQILLETVRKRIIAARRQIEELEHEWPEDKDSYPFIVYVLYKRRLEFLKSELEWLLWFEDILTSVKGDVLNMTWAEAI